jgi:hypothetical protein
MKKNLEFKIGIMFKGSQEKFAAFMENIITMRQQGIMIDTVPLPEHPASGLMIDTVPLPERTGEYAQYGHVHSPTHKIEGVFIGTWPTPEKAVGEDVITNLADGMPRVKLAEGITCGMRNSHLHLEDEIVLLDQTRFNGYVGSLIKGLAGQF